MSRSVRPLVVAAAVFAVVALPSPASAARHTVVAQANPPKLAAQNYAPFRRAARATDRLPAVIPGLSAATLRRLRTGTSRRIVSGTGFEVFMVLGAEPARRATGAGLRAELLYVRRQDGRVTGAGGRVTTRLAHALRYGMWASDRLPSGFIRTVVVVPDGTHDARHVGTGAASGVLTTAGGNALVDVAAGGRIEARDQRDRVVSFPLPLARVSGAQFTANLLEGSKVHLELAGHPATDLFLRGRVDGIFPSGYLLAHDNPLLVTDLALTVVQDAVPADPCANPGVPRLSSPNSGIASDPLGEETTGTIGSDGTVSVDAAVRLAAVLDLPGEHGCARIMSGIAASSIAVRLRGTLDPQAGLGRIVLTSDPTPVTVGACMVQNVGPLGPAPCAKTPVAVRATATVALVVALRLGG